MAERQSLPGSPDGKAPRAVVGLIDADVGYRASVRRLLEAAGHRVRDAEDPDHVLTHASGICIDCLVTELRVPRTGTVDVVRYLRRRSFSGAIVVVTADTTHEATVAAMKAGACDVLRKPPSAGRLLDAVDAGIRLGCATREENERRRMLLERLQSLTARETDVLRLVAAGSATKTIATSLGLSKRTVDHHRAALAEKLGARSVGDLVRIGIIAFGLGRASD